MQRLQHTAAVLLAFVTSINADEPVPVRLSLGGPRKVKATVAEKQDSFVITIHMIGVGCFDAATNDRLNRQKARQYALHAISLHLQFKDSLTVRGVTIAKTWTEGHRFGTTIVIPKHGIKHKEELPKGQSEPKVQPHGGLVVASDLDQPPGLLTAKSDYIATLEDLSVNLLETLPSIPKGQDGEDDFLTAIVDREESGVTSFSALQSEVASDKRLLKVEVEEIAALIHRAEAKFIERLKQHVDRFRSTTNKE